MAEKKIEYIQAICGLIGEQRKTPDAKQFSIEELIYLQSYLNIVHDLHDIIQQIIVSDEKNHKKLRETRKNEQRKFERFRKKWRELVAERKSSHWRLPIMR